MPQPARQHRGDIMSVEKRSALMGRIKGRDTGPEKLMAVMLRRARRKFETHASDLPGRPDIVFRNTRVAVFIDGDFWHGWRFPVWRLKLSEKWEAKIAANRRRDARNHARLRRGGWTVIRIWEHQIKSDAEACLQRVLTALRRGPGRVASGTIPSNQAIRELRGNGRMGLRGLDLFSGAGGSSRGAANAGVTMVGAVDMCPVATATYAENFPSARRNVVTTTLSDASGADIFDAIGKVDLLIASPECTHHSLARGNRPRCDDSRRSGWFVTRFIEDLEPQFLVLENVAMMRHWEGYKSLLEALEKRYGYKLRVQVLDAADFGVPQNRKRLFIYGSRRRLPAPIETPNLPKISARAILDRVGTWPAGPLDNGRRALATLERVQRGISEVGRYVDFLTVYYGSDKAGGYQTLDRPLRTLTTLDRFGLVQWIKRKPTLRMLQVPELKRAMGLPEDFLLNIGTRRDNIRLLGNGVCPPVMEAVVRALTETSRKTLQRELQLVG